MFVAEILEPVSHLRIVNADLIAAQMWPDAQLKHAYDASRTAADERQPLLIAGASFITETVFSHASKVELVAQATTRGYVVHLNVVLVPEAIAVARVAARVAQGGHDVPEHKIRERYARIWPLVVAACALTDRATFYDNSRAASPFRVIARYERGRLVGESWWPAWTPKTLLI